MIIIEKWVQLPTTYRIFYPTSAKIDPESFFPIINCVENANTIIDCVDLANTIIECNTNGGGGGISEAEFILVNSSNYHEYRYIVAPDKSNNIYLSFELTIEDAIECGDYQAFLVVDGKPLDAIKFRIVAPKTPYNEYNPNRNITIYER